jgi:hypothetical protein
VNGIGHSAEFLVPVAGCIQCVLLTNPPYHPWGHPVRPSDPRPPQKEGPGRNGRRRPAGKTAKNQGTCKKDEKASFEGYPDHRPCLRTVGKQSVLLSIVLQACCDFKDNRPGRPVAGKKGALSSIFRLTAAAAYFFVPGDLAVELKGHFESHPVVHNELPGEENNCGARPSILLNLVTGLIPTFI